MDENKLLTITRVFVLRTIACILNLIISLIRFSVKITTKKPLMETSIPDSMIRFRVIDIEKNNSLPKTGGV